MDHQTVNHLISDMKKAGIVTKATPWIKDEYRRNACEARYIGIQIPDDWHEIVGTRNHLLLKFVINRSTAVVEIYLANQTPFLKITQLQFNEDSKWQHILGEFKRRLNKDHQEYQKGSPNVTNLYSKIKPHLKA